MEIRDRVDPVRIGEELIYTIFHHIFHDEGARHHFGFSQINFFNSSEGLPGWNIWLADDTGAYQLVLVRGDVGEGDRANPPLQEFCTESAGTVVTGRFLIRYFPDADDPLLDRYSCAEALLRYGDLFDHTGTPSLAGQETIGERCFVVGYLDFITNLGRDFVELKCIAPNTWKDVRPAGLYIDVPGGQRYEAVEPGGTDRDVPGWDLAFSLFDRLTTAFGYVHRRSPRAAVLSRKKWVRFELGDTTCTETSDFDVDLFQLMVGFPMTCEGHAGHCSHSERAESYVEDVTDRLIAEGFTSVETSLDGNGPAGSVLKRAWWTAGHMNFSSDPDSEMQHCCYHDH